MRPGHIGPAFSLAAVHGHRGLCHCMSDRIAPARAIAARTKQRFIEIAREKRKTFRSRTSS